MYKLPDTSCLNQLVGEEVNLFSVGPYDVQIAFEKGTVIQALHKLEGQVLGEREVWFDDDWITTKDIIHVPKKKVVSITNESELILKIELSNNIRLFVHTEISLYESININFPSGECIVI